MLPARQRQQRAGQGLNRQRRRLRKRYLILLALACTWAGTALWHVTKPLPPGTHVMGPFAPVPEASLRLLTDVTSADHFAALSSHQSIHAATLQLVRDAQHFLVLDYFLFNGQGGPAGPLRYERGLRPVSAELVAALRELKLRQPQLPVLVLVDPINDYYRGTPPPQLAELVPLGVNVVVTRLEGLRDSNPAYSALWRLFGAWWLDPAGEGSWKNRLDAAGPRVRLGALLSILNFKANHRKAAITATAEGALRGIIASANPHDASSAHSNVALQLDGEALRPLLDSELAVARFSGWKDDAAAAFRRALPPPATTASEPASAQDIRAAVATEGAIREQLVQKLAATGQGDDIDIAMFYLSERQVIDALLSAVRRGATARVLLDPNKDAFGFEKSGIPNRQVASELIASSNGALRLRWFRTHGEQFHTKLIAIRGAGRLWLMLGSANLTRRNVGDYNLEANVIVDAPANGRLATDVATWFEMLWTNRPGGTDYSAEADLYAEPGTGRYWLYRFMEASGLSTF